MLINEAIRRADALVTNEYSDEEKYHWCDIVTAELVRSYSRQYARVKLFSCADGRFLLPEDCGFEYIDRLIYRGNIILKEDMRSYGFRTEPSGSGRVYLACCAENIGEENIDVVYQPEPKKIRRISVHNEPVILPSKDKDGKRQTFRMENTCPFIPGDCVELVYVDKKYNVNILSRTADLDEINMKLYYVLECGSGETDDLPSGEIRADMTRLVTDRTLCAAPYDEMYTDYIAAQICFYQRKLDVYQQFMARYNARFEEYGRVMKSRDTAQTDCQFVNYV